MSKESKDERLQNTLANNFKNAWQNQPNETVKEIFNFANEYKSFLDDGKTERECTKVILKYAKDNGFKDINTLIDCGKKLKPGMKIYAVNRDKAIALFIIGKENIEKGTNIVGAHIDSPRLDIKANPLFEDTEMAFLKTHYYGGIKKYQWTAMPLALHGVIIDEDGRKIDVNIGEENDDPVLYITDILPHLAKDQNDKKLSEAISGEKLNILIGSIPCGDDKIKDKVKFNILRILNEKYGIKEIDLTNAELEVVPAGKARDVGLDRGLIVAYGHDDRVCSFAGLKGILEVGTPEKTAILYCADKEEVGSNGNTGAQSDFLLNTIAELIALQDNYSDLLLRRALNNTKVLSADVCAPQDPNYPDITDKYNTGYMGKGLQITKYTGARGKAGCNDANAEFIAQVSRLFSKKDVAWQIGELGKVDQGGGGTIAFILANANADVVDCGVPVLSMHAPYEVISKIDIYMAYKGYREFLTNNF
ncbi:MAG TPA: aminopeptidase [Victivallales bacterium]|nr:aminopeptidase [Victivallales bacterium]